MSLRTLFRPLFGPRKPSARHRRTALKVERFEDRTVPAGLATFASEPTVQDLYGTNNVAYDGPGGGPRVATVGQELFSIGSVEKVGVVSPTPRSPVLQPIPIP
jgi:hypothetical protein